MDRGLTVDSSRIERWQLRRGDHIYVWRIVKRIPDAGGINRIYSHHGIYESDEKVIQLTWSILTFSIPNRSKCLRCHGAKRRGDVVVCCLDCFLGKGGQLWLFAYAVPKWFYDARNAPNEGDVLAPLRQLTCSMDAEDPPETVLRRANDLLAHGGSRSVYDPVYNNCFHFAFYCKTGRQYCGKVTLVLGISAAAFMVRQLGLPSDDEADFNGPNGSPAALRVAPPPPPPPRPRSPPRRPRRRDWNWDWDWGRFELPQPNLVTTAAVGAVVAVALMPELAPFAPFFL